MKKHLIFLLTALFVSALAVTGTGAYLRYEVLQPLDIQREDSLIALPFVFLADEGLTRQIELETARLNAPPTEPPTEPTTVPTTVPPTEVTTAPTTEPPTEPPTEPEPTYLELDESWFDDALFIGESRTTGLRDCARLGGADYFCAGSMTVYGILGVPCGDYDFPEMLLSDLLYQKQYGKVFIHLGLNECLSNHDDVMKFYKMLTDLIQETQPDAVIVLQAILSIGRNKEMYSDYSLERVQAMNDRIRTFAEEEGFLFTDINEHFADEEGYLPEGMSSDGCHPYAKYYSEWSQWILKDAGWFCIP